MDILKMLSDLRSARNQIEGAILVLERLARGQVKRQGQPPKWMPESMRPESALADSRKKRVVSPEARRRMAEAQRKRWAAVRKTEVKKA